ncbi:MAG TPA: hypothetical protein VFP58_15340 [Candidatus Eisenbacteria bacterium]|nr:hypothetical protein [Candidatus Eisenbacteria bacterium]
MGEGEYRKAARLLEAVRLADPNDPYVYVHLAAARAGLRQYRAAAGAVRIGIERAAERRDSLASENLLEHQGGAVETFLRHTRSVLARVGPVETSRLVERMDSILVMLPPSRPESLLSDTTSLFAGGMKDLGPSEGLACFQLATQMNPRDAKPFALVAFLYLHDEKWTHAKRVLRVGLKRAPGDRDLNRHWDHANRTLKSEFAY